MSADVEAQNCPTQNRDMLSEQDQKEQLTARATNCSSSFPAGWAARNYIWTSSVTRLRARHMPFAVDEAARDAWMLCMKKAIEDMEIEDPLLKQHLLHSLFKTADFMRNQPEAQ
jgi:hypothetical protein